MQIALISPYSNLANIGLRLISSTLKQAGHGTKLIMVPLEFMATQPPSSRFFAQDMLDQLLLLLKDVDMVGVSLMTDYYIPGKQLTDFIHQHANIPVIWGGVHPTIAPEECINIADYVLVGEGEDIIVDLVNRLENGQDVNSLQSLWVRNKDRIYRNPIKKLRQDLNDLPLPDYDLSAHFLWNEGRFKPMTHDLLKQNFTLYKGADNPELNTSYQILTGRGCPHRCTYCINHVLTQLYGKKGYLRWRSLDHVIEELEFVKHNMHYVDNIWISDDAFFSQSLKRLEEFARIYKEKIDLPFTALTSPATINEQKLIVLMQAGLRNVQMGVQTMSEKTNQLYGRALISGKQVVDAMELLHKYSDKLGVPHYDFIIDNPFEDLADQKETLKFIAQMPRPYFIRLFKMHLFPGTGLFNMAVEHGLLPEHGEMGIRWHQLQDTKPSYSKLLFRLFRRPRLPSIFFKLLVSTPVFNLFTSKAAQGMIEFFYSCIKRCRKAG